jgi:pSer/pThr/pTyr-binding forkhead associated (FHA) protein
MAATVTLSMLDEGHPIRELTFHNRTVGVVGRASNCYLQLPSDFVHLTASRHHCLLDIDPPDVRVQDLGSRNGTFVNGIKIGQRHLGADPDDTIEDEGPLVTLKDGDEVRVGETVLRFAIRPEPETPAEDAPHRNEDAEPTGRGRLCEVCGSSATSAIP